MAAALICLSAGRCRSAKLNFVHSRVGRSATMPSIWIRTAIICGMAALQAAAGSAALAGDAKEGRAIAERWCTACHNIGSGDKPAASDLIPTFDSIARRPDLNRVQLETWIGNPHPPMPNLSLTRNEIDNLVTYIESLRTPR
jgi:cytochrome c